MISRRKLMIAAAAALLPAAAAAATTPAAAPETARKAAQKPAPRKQAARKKAPPAPPRLVITVNKVSQKMTVVLDGEQLYKWPVSTGAAGYETPSGSYKPFRMEKEHFSKEWDDAPMPYSIFFTGEGHALHGSYHVKSLGRRASHGCVRILPANAAILYGLVQKTGMSNTLVVIKGGFFSDGADPTENKPMPFASWFH